MESIKQRIFTGWSLQRAMFLGIGFIIIMNAYTDRMWTGVAFGTYFAAMGLFGFGCASGNCYTGNCDVEPNKNAVEGETLEVEELN